MSHHNHVGRAARVFHAFALQPFSQIARDLVGAVVAEQARLVTDMGPIICARHSLSNPRARLVIASNR